MWFNDDGVSKQYRNGQIILPQGFVGQAMGLVEDGQVEVFFKTEEGDETICRVLGSNEMFGVDSLFENKPRRTGIRALGKAKVALMDRRNFIRYTHREPQLAFNVLQSVCYRIKKMGEKL